MPESSTASSATHDPELRDAIYRCGYYPPVVVEAVESAVAGERVVDFVIHHEPTFDREEVRRHVTVLVLTDTRVVVAHTDEHPADELLPKPYASTSTEAIPLSRVRSVVTSRMVADPASYEDSDQVPEADEAVLTIGWGAVNRLDMEPATCGDPECTGDHGYTGTMTADDFSIRMSAAADGPDAVQQLLSFATSLSAGTAR